MTFVASHDVPGVYYRDPSYPLNFQGSSRWEATRHSRSNAENISRDHPASQVKAARTIPRTVSCVGGGFFPTNCCNDDTDSLPDIHQPLDSDAPPYTSVINRSAEKPVPDVSRETLPRGGSIMADQLYGNIHAVYSNPDRAVIARPHKHHDRTVSTNTKQNKSTGDSAEDISEVLSKVAAKLEQSGARLNETRSRASWNAKVSNKTMNRPWGHVPRMVSDVTSDDLSAKVTTVEAVVHANSSLLRSLSTMKLDNSCRPNCHCQKFYKPNGNLEDSDQSHTTEVGPPSSGREAVSSGSDHSSFFSISSPRSDNSHENTMRSVEQLAAGADIMIHYEPQSSQQQSESDQGSPFDSSSLYLGAGDATYNVMFPCLSLPSYLLEERFVDDHDGDVDSDKSSFIQKPLASHGITYNTSLYRKTNVAKLLRRVGKTISKNRTAHDSMEMMAVF